MTTVTNSPSWPLLDVDALYVNGWLEDCNERETMERNVQGQYVAEVKPEAMLSQVATHYYTLRMGEREIGGTNKEALARFARKHGYRVTERKTLRAADWTL